ncbi:hypothetical protein C8J48_0763 [Desmospora activa DSM 45169]|uniref:Uncharacterized protein n=1 Tax=Desmospora activa DSM 45169 TaxID=1121389 RepID=A0A2T4Z8K1_9BACL|nr:hypothetical protein C8J48_0763 [Desmospora activa DSM 45169]
MRWTPKCENREIGHLPKGEVALKDYVLEGALPEGEVALKDNALEGALPEGVVGDGIYIGD